MPSPALNGMPPRRVRAVIALLRQPTLAKAAREAGLNERTLRRWLNDEGFRAALDATRHEVYGEVLSCMQGGAEKALEALHGVLDDDAARPSEKVAAARILLDQAHRAAEVLDLDERMSALEKALEAREDSVR